MTTGLWVLMVAVGVALGFGGYRALTDGRFHGMHRVRQAAIDRPSALVVPPSPVGDPGGTWRHVTAAISDVQLGEKATLLQFSSAFCAPCRVTRRTLSEVANLVPGVEHVEVDAEHHLELVRRLGILRTPTTLVLDRDGREVTRAAGAPRKEQVLTALARA